MSSFAAAAAHWPRPNYVDPETRGPVGKIVEITLISLMTLIVILRLYTRHSISKGFGLDDILIMVSYVPAAAYGILGIYGDIYLEWNRHIWDVEPRLFVPSLQTSLAELVLFDLSTSITKLSMLAMIHRLVSSSKNKTMARIVVAIAAFISINAIIFLFITVFQCSPVSAYWTITSAPRNCINEAAHLLGAGIINTATDLVLVFLPMHTVFKLDLPAKQRIIVVGLFGAGFLACAAGGVRIYFTWQMSTAADHDLTWNAWATWMASSVELYIGIICASIPAIKPFFATYLPKLVGASLRSTRSGPYLKDPKMSHPAVHFTAAKSSVDTFIYGPSTPDLSTLLKPKDMASAQQEKSSSGDQVVATTTVQTTTLIRSKSSTNLNKPLPVIQPPQRQTLPPPPPLLPLNTLQSSAPSPTSPLSQKSGWPRTAPSQRNALLFSKTASRPHSIESAPPENRTTVFIMLDGKKPPYPGAI